MRSAVAEAGLRHLAARVGEDPAGRLFGDAVGPFVRDTVRRGEPDRLVVEAAPFDDGVAHGIAGHGDLGLGAGR